MYICTCEILNNYYFIQYVDDNSATGDGGSIQPCLSNKLADVATRDLNCANSIGMIINTTHDYDYSNYNHYSSYPSAYFNYDLPQDTFDVICTPSCRNELTNIYHQCSGNRVRILCVAASYQYLLTHNVHKMIMSIHASSIVEQYQIALISSVTNTGIFITMVGFGALGHLIS